MIPVLIQTAFHSLFVGSANVSVVAPARPASLLEELQARIQARSDLPKLIAAYISRSYSPQAGPAFDFTVTPAFAEFRPFNPSTPPEPASDSVRAGRI